MINICAYFPEQEIKTFHAIVYLQLEIAILNRGKLHINTCRLSLSPLLPERISNLKPSVGSSSSRKEEKPSQPSSTLTLSAPLNIFIVSPKAWGGAGQTRESLRHMCSFTWRQMLAVFNAGAINGLLWHHSDAVPAAALRTNYSYGRLWCTIGVPMECCIHKNDYNTSLKEIDK